MLSRKQKPTEHRVASLLRSWSWDYVAQNNLAFKVLLILYNTPGRPGTVQRSNPNIDVIFVPPNTTSVILPSYENVTTERRSKRAATTNVAAWRKELQSRKQRTTVTPLSLLSELRFQNGKVLEDTFSSRSIHSHWESHNFHHIQYVRKCAPGVATLECSYGTSVEWLNDRGCVRRQKDDVDVWIRMLDRSRMTRSIIQYEKNLKSQIILCNIVSTSWTKQFLNQP
jgi:hypothetical protein